MQDGQRFPRTHGSFGAKRSESDKPKVETGPLTFLVALAIICFTILGIVSLITGNPLLKM